MKLFLLFSLLLIGVANGQGFGNFACWFIRCPFGTKCQVVSGFPQCVAIPPQTCASIQCPPPLTCALVQQYWCSWGSCQPQPQCIAYDPCLYRWCPWGYECYLAASFCTPPFVCWPSAQCRQVQTWPWWWQFSREGVEGKEPTCEDLKCKAPSQCALIKSLSCGDKKDFCPLKFACITKNACVGHECKKGFECVLKEVKCAKPPCNPVAECDPTPEPEVKPEGSGKPLGKP